MSQWREILINCGIDGDLLVKKGTACPICQDGTDRFTFDDRNGNGDYYCRICNRGGDGFGILKKVFNLTFNEALAMAREAGLPITRSVTNHEAIASHHNLAYKQELDNTINLLSPAQGTIVETYLNKRGLSLPAPISNDVQCFYCPKIPIFDQQDNKTYLYQGMVWKLRSSLYGLTDHQLNDIRGQELMVHQTLITNEGYKANGSGSKMYSKRWLTKATPLGAMYAPIAYSKAAQVVVIAEGIEDTLAAHHIIKNINGIDCSAYAMTNAGNMNKFADNPMPNHLMNKVFYIFSDADESFVGQMSAFTCAKKICGTKVNNSTCRVFVPKRFGTDWADIVEQSLPEANDLYLF